VKNKPTLLIVVLFLTQFLTAQENTEKWIKGQISDKNSALQGINVVNTASKTTSVSDQYGSFSILAKEGEVLSFSAFNYEPLRKMITQQEFNLGNIVVNMTATVIELKEVVVKGHPEISAENLGIIPRDQVKLTVAERRLQTAGDFKPIHLLGLLAGSLELDPIMNAINGRTKRLKKEIILERKELLMARFDGFFEDKYYIETLKIPEELIKGFQYYCVEDASFVSSIQSKNKTMIMFLITGLAANFNEKRKNDVETN
jgi:hypothetical protein